MGFERANAEAALLAFNNDLARAIDALCSGCVPHFATNNSAKYVILNILILSQPTGCLFLGCLGGMY